jgi:hypothetical protein
MKTRITLIVAAFFGVMFTAELRAEGTAFTHQGQPEDQPLAFHG